MQKIINLLLRLLAMGAKFLLVIFIGKYLSSEALGEYGLFFSTITIAIFFLGMDFYVFNTREIIATSEKNKKAILIRDQFIFYIFTYIIILPLLIVVFFLNIIDFKYMILFYLVLVAEHISQEFYRLFITLSRQTLATFLLFIRSGIWIYVLVAVWVLDLGNLKNLKFVYIGWLFGAFLSVAIGIFYLIKDYGLNNFKGKINFTWIKSGLKISMPFFMGTIAYKIVEFSNRYIIDFFMSKSDVGVFTFFANIANALQTIVYTLVIMMYYPKIIAAYQSGSETATLIKNFTKETILYSMICSVVIAISIYPILGFLNKTEFFENLPIFWILLISILFANLSLVPHYQLFAMKKDILIRNITIGVAILNVVLTLTLVYFYGLYGAAIAMIISYFAMYFIKYRKVKNG